MSYDPPTGSVVVYQIIPSSLLTGASIIGRPPVAVTNTPSISGTVDVNPTSVLVLNPVSILAVNPNPASVQVLNPVSILAVTQSGTRITSLVSTVPSSVIIGASIFGLPPVNVTNTNLNVGGSVISFQGGAWTPSVSGIVGASIIGQPLFRSADGASVATIRDLAANDALNVAIVDASGDQIVSFGGGTQYEENVADASVVGTAMMWKSNLSSSILSVVNPANPLPVSVQGTISINPASVSGTVGASIIGLTPVAVSDGTETLDLYEENQIDASVVGIAVMFKSNVSSSIISVVTPNTPLPIIGSVSGSVG